MTKTYEQRLSDLATEMAKDTWLDLFGTNDFEKFLNEELIQSHTPYATIALKHMAAAFLKGYESGVYDANGEDKPLPLSEQLQSLGLIPPQKP